MPEQKKILITGGSGFVGKNLAEYLREKFQILTPGRNELDLLDFLAVQKYLKDNSPYAVIHAAGEGVSRTQKGQSGIFENNFLMFENLCRCNSLFAKMLFLGSGAEYDKSRSLVKVREEEFGQSLPKDDYGLAKYRCSKLIETEKNILSLRLFGLFGKYEDYKSRFISNAICRALFNLPITVTQDVKFDYLYINDFVRIAEHFILSDAKKKFFNAGTGRSISLLEIIKQLELVHGKKLEVEVKTPGLGKEYTCDNARLMQELPDFKFTPFDQSLSELYNWYKQRLGEIDKDKLVFDK